MEFQPYMIVQVIFFVFVAIFLGYEIQKAKGLSLSDRKLTYCTLVILLAGILVRSINLTYPHGIFVDEAMGAYDSWCLAHFGVDSNLASYPVYLKSWGTGQSALYAYFALPFIKIFGLNIVAYRLPMSIIGCLALIILYLTVKKGQKNTLATLSITAFLAINPWHIIKSRFAVDCNICPDLILIGVCLIIWGYYSTHKKQLWYYLGGFIMLSVSAYGYGISWMVLPFIYVLTIWFLYKKGGIDIKKIAIVSIVSAIVLLPLVLFAFGLFLKWDQFSLGFITITQLSADRHDNTTLLGASNIPAEIIRYTKYAYKIVITGVDNLNASSLPVSGVFYNIVSLPFLAYGLYKSIKAKDITGRIFLIWLISCLPLLLLVEPTINHWNLIWFPVIYFTGYGIFRFVEISRTNLFIIGAIYILSFGLFLRNYFDKNIYSPFNSYMFEKEIRFVGSKQFNKIYYPQDIIHSFTLFYNPVDPYTFAKTFVSDGNDLAQAVAYDNISFGLPAEIHPQEKTAYVISNASLPSIDLTGFNIEKGIYYSVLWSK